jgi:hypothetical protein
MINKVLAINKNIQTVLFRKIDKFIVFNKNY